jgi:hypothetical protein
MSASLRLVRNTDGSDELPPLVAWELLMRGAGRAGRTVTDGLRVRELVWNPSRSLASPPMSCRNLPKCRPYPSPPSSV